MNAMVLERQGTPLVERILGTPEPGAGQLLLRVRTCAVCRTDVHVIDGDLREPRLPLVPGHEIVGVVERAGAGVKGFTAGDRVGVPWLGWTCGACAFCISGRENLCPAARFTGYQIDGGYAEYTVADARFCFPLEADLDDLHAAPLLCAGLIGYRAYRMAGPAERLGFYGFGAAAHILTQIATRQGRRVFAFTRPGDSDGQEFARSLGVEWAGGSRDRPPEALDAAIIFAPVGGLVPAALRAVAPGGTVVCAGIHMSGIPAFPYEILWQERVLRSVANLTRADGQEFLPLAAATGVRPRVRRYALTEANQAVDDVRRGTVVGAAVLQMS